MARSTATGRHFVVDALQAWRLTGAIDAAALLTSEVVTNAVLHARTPLTVAVRRLENDQVEVAVSDGSPVRPALRKATADSTNGRGLALLDRLAARWSVTVTPAGKTVAFTVDPGRDPWAVAADVDWLAMDL